MHSPMGSYESLGATGVAAVSRSLVFVVEDEEDIARLISHNLQAAGFDVQSLVSGGVLVFVSLLEKLSLFFFFRGVSCGARFFLFRPLLLEPPPFFTPLLVFSL